MLYEYPPLPLLARLVREEITQRTEEGCNTEGFRERWAAAQESCDALANLYDALCALTVAPDFPFVEPSDLESIRQQRTRPSQY